MIDNVAVDREYVYDLLAEYPQERRRALIADSSDWDRIGPALYYFGDTLSMFAQIPNGLRAWLGLHRCLLEVIYTMGYERGQREQARPLPEFIVAPEDQSDDSHRHDIP